VAGNGGGHDADRAGSGDEDVFAEHGEGEGGVDGVSEGIEDGGDLVLDAGGVLPDVGHGQNDVLGEGSVAIDTYAEGMGTEMTAAGEAVAAASADDVAFAGDELAYGDVSDVRAKVDDLSDKFVADDETLADSFAGPGIPIVDVEIGAADSCVEDADLNVVDADGGFRNVFKPEATVGMPFYKCLQGKCLSGSRLA